MKGGELRKRKEGLLIRGLGRDKAEAKAMSLSQTRTQSLYTCFRERRLETRVNEGVRGVMEIPRALHSIQTAFSLKQSNVTQN